MIERYDNFTKVFPGELLFGAFNGQPIPYDYYNFLNDDNDNGNNIPGTPIEDILPENEGVEYSGVPNYEDIDYEIIIDGDDSLASSIDPLQNEII